MATLTRPRSAPTSQNQEILISGVPTPFPVDQLARDEEVRPVENPFVAQEEETQVEEAAPESQTNDGVELTEIMPSIATLQRSCIMTLNTLLSGSGQWKSIVPDRRHSMPSSAGTSAAPQLNTESFTAGLETLVVNLRTKQASDEMVEFHQPTSDSDLSFELQERVRTLSPSLSPNDATLANSLATILTYFDRLSILQRLHPTPNASTSTNTPRVVDAPPPIDMYDALTRQLNDLQLERLLNQRPSTSSSSTSHHQMEIAILWSQIDHELENIVSMCKERTERLPRFYQENLPPQYDYDYDESYDFESPPEYDGTGRRSLELSKDSKSERLVSPSSITNDEKMRLDLEGVAMAIDRLYLVAPQLHNQRAELKASKIAQLERARKEGSTSSRKGKERDRKELENIIDMIGKASERTLKDQSVVLENGMQSRLEKAKIKDLARRDAFVENLMKHSAAGRMHGQDAVLTPKIKDPQAKLTFPEFIRESIPPDSELLQDPSVMLSLPEFVAQLDPDELSSNAATPRSRKQSDKAKKKSRSRSLSAPPLAWLRSKSTSNVLSGTASPKRKAQEAAFDIVYVAENHENLQHVLVFFTATADLPSGDLTAEILPPFPEHVSTGGDHLVIKSGAHASLPLILPGRTSPGRKDIQVQGSHFEIKLGTVMSTTTPSSSSSSLEDADGLSSPLLDAAKLSQAKPSTFTCASCSLPLIHPAKETDYRDLPSEHWEELVEAWMCHSDQKLHDQVMKHGKAGFWPQPGQAFVGGSYILFEDSVVAERKLLSPQDDKNDEDWKVRRCLCGSIVGRSQTKEGDDGLTTTCFKILKYAIRPVTSNPSESLNIPLSAFIVEDMMEYVQAHASYRFVIRDEEEEKPRILIWLFKPKIRLAYTTPRSRAIPKSGSISAAKVLYKLLGPTESRIPLKTLLDRFPGFPQAEYLSYPMSVCRRLAALLKESNTAYPERLRTMTGLEVGWLHRR